MSQSVTLSSSPFTFRDLPTPSFFYAPFAPAAPNFERRRTSHPHNPHSQNSQRASVDMPERSESQQRPRLEHRASQTIIDLTDEPEEARVASRNNESSGRNRRPPQLGRSDAISLGGGNLIDLTDDNDDFELLIMGERIVPTPPRPNGARIQPRPAERPMARPAAGRQESPSLFMPQLPDLPPDGGFAQGVFRALAGHNAFDLGLLHRGPHLHMNHPQFGIEDARFFQAIQLQMPQIHQQMPGVMNYGSQARKPEHVAPSKARDNFTRSPKENDTIVCPSCEEELIHNKDAEEEPVAKRGGKAPTRKDREEHPFWVVKDCGHVRCSLSFGFCVSCANVSKGLLQ